MLRKLILQITISATLIFSTNNLFSQCCAAGNPVSGYGSVGEGGKNVLKISLLYNHSYSDTYYEGTSISDYRYLNNSYLDFSAVQLLYGITKKFKAQAEIGYFFSKSQTFEQSGYKRKAYGWGDFAASLQYSLIQDEYKKFEIKPSFKLTIPTGEFDQIQDNVVLPIDIQPSAGSLKFNTGLYIYKGLRGDKLSFYSMNFMEISQRIQTDRTENYKYGNLYILSVAGVYKIRKNMIGTLLIRDQIREKSSNRDVILESTGGNVLFVVPQLIFSTKNFWELSVMTEIPLYKNLNGKQLSNKYTYSIKLSKSINFNKKNCDTTSAGFDNYKEVKFPVNGLCGMCKERIEKAALKNKNVKYAYWDDEKKLLTVRYDKEIDLLKLKLSISKAGHDTDETKAADKVYDKLPACCKYRDSNPE